MYFPLSQHENPFHGSDAEHSISNKVRPHFQYFQPLFRGRSSACSALASRTSRRRGHCIPDIRLSCISIFILQENSSTKNTAVPEPVLNNLPALCTDGFRSSILPLTQDHGERNYHQTFPNLMTISTRLTKEIPGKSRFIPYWSFAVLMLIDLEEAYSRLEAR
jgi:hypothetical protein